MSDLPFDELDGHIDTLSSFLSTDFHRDPPGSAYREEEAVDALREGISKLREERDELLEALRGLEDLAILAGLFERPQTQRAQARLAKAEGQEAKP